MSIITLILFGLVFLLIVYSVLNNTFIIQALQPIEKSKNMLNDADEIIRQHMFDNYLDLERSTKKKIFIHMPYERNERNWINYGSRSTKNLNLDICMLCIQSMIHCLGYENNIILYNNDNVKDLIKESNENDLCNYKTPHNLSGTDLKQWESYCKAKILYKFGGIVMEPYYYFIEKPKMNLLHPNQLTLCHELNHQNVSEKRFIPTTNHWMSAPKGDKDVGIYIQYLKYLCVNHYTADHKHFDKTFEKLYALNYLHPKKTGCADKNNDPVHVSDLISKKEVQFDNSMFCLFIDVPYLKKYRKDAWILKMNEKQIQESNTLLGEMIRTY